MAIATLYGNLTPTEKFISSTMDGAEMVHMARTKMIQEVYAANSREHLEELVGAKLVKFVFRYESRRRYCSFGICFLIKNINVREGY